MRPPAIEKMGYYPTDDPILEIISTYLKSPLERGRLLDPCAGEGKAAAALGYQFNCETWGAELSPDRAEMAVKVMDRVYQAPWQSCFLSEESVTWLYLNPPYDTDRLDESGSGGRKRLEWEFLKTTTGKLMRGGLLTYLVPQKVLGIAEVASHLAACYENIRIYRYPDGLFERFHQVVVLATRRNVACLPTEDEIAAIRALSSSELEPVSCVAEPCYQLLPAPVR
jgi:hypothetical protein